MMMLPGGGGSRGTVFDIQSLGGENSEYQPVFLVFTIVKDLLSNTS